MIVITYRGSICKEPYYLPFGKIAHQSWTHKEVANEM
jgi:hypothetical protein